MQQPNKGPTNKPIKDPTTQVGQRMLVLAWIIIIISLTYYFHEPIPNRSQFFSEHAIEETGVAVIEGNRRGHYYSYGTINNQEVVFFVDTGATTVSVPQHIARQLKLKKGMPVEMSTANGIVTAYLTHIDELTIGGIALYDIDATINPGMESDEILLGMSALKQLEFSQSGNTLTLIKRR